MYKMSDSFWEITYRQNIAKMIGVCCRYTQNRQTAEDLAHDAFLLAIDKVSSFENKGPFEAWLRRIAVNVSLQYLREQKRQEKWEKTLTYDAIGNEIEEENPAGDQRFFSEAELLEVIGHLPDHHRIVFNLYVADNFTHAQIAARLGISEGTSKSHLARARKKIRELLNDKLRKDKERKSAFIWLIFSYRTGNIDRLVAGKLHNLAIRPQRKFYIDNTNPGAPVPDFKPAGISYAASVKTGLMAIATAMLITGGSNLPDPAANKDIIPMKLLTPVPAPNGVSAHPLFSGPDTATISENSVIVEKTQNSEPMENLSILGGLMVASMALDTANLPTELPVAFKNHQLMINHESVAKRESVGPIAQQHSDVISGSFYASQLLWSGKDGALYFFGEHVKVNVTGNKFSGSGKFSFLNKVNYLVVDGVPMKQNENIRLQDKKYTLVSLNESEGSRKYGENGKSGVVEITLSE